LRWTTSCTWALGLLGSVAVVGCADESAAPSEGAVGSAHEQIFSNGNFESGSASSPPPGWTVTPYLNLGVTSTTPTTRANLQLQSGGSAQTTLLTGAQESLADSALGTGASLRYPKYGSGVAVVNVPGASRNVNSMKQSMTIVAGDVDPADGKPHVRFTVAPVLENPGHGANEQPYYFVQLTNTTRGTVLYKDYNASAQPGVPWKVSNGVYYTDWQLVDIAPGSAELALGDQVELEVIAAGCSQGGHFGRVYVDGVGSTVPGLFVAATGPASANAGSNVTYTLAYKNGGTGGASATSISFATPPSTKFVSVAGAQCSTPSAGSTGTVTCPVGAVAAGATGSLQVTVSIDSNATGKITAGDYSIKATSVTPLLGPKVYTTVTSGISYADLSISKTNGTGGVAWGQAVTYTIGVSNAGPSAVSAVKVTDTLPAQLTGATWTCAGVGGAACAASGTGSISDGTVSLPVGSTATYTLHANVVAGTGNGTLQNNASVTLPASASDPDPSNNAAGDSDPIGPLRALSVTKAGSGQGTIGSVPAAIACDATCASANGSFVDGSTVILSATPAAGDTFLGWSGACSGTGACNLTMGADQSVVATFQSPLADNGTSCGQASECASGTCVDGLCCDTACGGGAADCQACNLPGHLGTCTPVSQGTECRASAGACDVAESCDGANAACPADAKVSQGTECRASAGACDVAESCDGANASCPADAKVSQGTECRASAGACDVAESCDGANAACPADAKVSQGTECRASAGGCDVAESCDGANAACPTDAKVSQGTECRASAGACDVAESCDGANAACPTDAKVSQGTECRAASCDGGVEAHAASCDGSAISCPTSTTASCGAFVCGGAACLASCASDAECSSGNYCAADGSCQPTLTDGGVCSMDRMCGSGHCADGVCCNTSCDGQCEACNADQHVGECVAVSGSPRGGRAACDGEGTCGGSCDGSNRESCAMPGSDVECRAASCVAGVATVAMGCNGAGSCPVIPTQSCGAFVCGATQCLGDCQADGDCADGNFCSAGVCIAKRTAAGSCNGDNQCASGFCTDGVCCDVACDGQCEACDAEGSEGTCSPVVGAPHNARPACAADGSACDGTCDGLDGASCTYPSTDTSCRAASCADGVAVAEAICNGAGKCPEEIDVACGDYVCGETSCLGDCGADSDCSEGKYCLAGICAPVETLGESCSASNECASGYCVDGICCDTSCEGQCEACDASGSLGVCAPVAGDPHGAREACASDATVCGGTCGGEERNACTYPALETECRAASCSDGVATIAAYCDASGACPALETQGCDAYECGPAACLGDCETSADCAEGRFCSAGICTPTLGDGLGCGGDGECASGFCVDGTCCERACDGQCEACDASGSEGRCVPVSGEPHGGRAACGGQGSCAGACGGEDTQACVFPGASTECGAATCADGIASMGAVCNGEGSCDAQPSTACGAYPCEGQACATSCNEDADCQTGHICIDSACLSGERPSNEDTMDDVDVQGGCACEVPASNDNPWRALGALALGAAWVIRSRRRRA